MDLQIRKRHPVLQATWREGIATIAIRPLGWNDNETGLGLAKPNQEASMTTTVRGVIRGKTIELADDPGIEDGRGVEVTFHAVSKPDAQIEAIHRTAGAMAGDPKFAALMAEIEQQRRATRYRDQTG